ncbi:DHHA2 domain protein (macronuclear) [Tetrahymena thermophila SB210]|uniref:DHHA2 domain protein n=1 Tax=Tetrahymena thermophila (strain SB210) TaxID=312017 RepID=I7M9K3_TETTS|nr:DHHA2 domain protein [Tetrahymena thermophila SB210]EAS02002.3 DHHA2 domain protein [Tetrahymena thermophila SB210]|eukprot:XP_001022247.3 DHHA2 domain protein [Tetrahymena thermophila SB210]
MGNESADLDSNIGSMIYAYFKFCQAEKNYLNYLKENSVYEQMDFENLLNMYLPVIQCDRQDINSRFESLDLLETHQIHVDDIIFKDDFNIQEVITASKLDVILYDHNCTIYPTLKSRVVEITDHHQDTTDQFYEKNQKIIKNIATVGSATTLLGEYFIQGNEDILDPIIADSIMKTIIVDSYNFDKKLENIRWNNRDSTVLNYMTSYLQGIFPQQNFDKNEIFSKIEALKFDVKKNSNLGIPKLLTKDYKQFNYQNNTNVGYSVFMISPEAVFETYSTEKLEQEIEIFFKNKNLDLLILLFAYPTKEHFERKFISLSQKNRLDDLNQVKQHLCTSLKVTEVDYSKNFNNYKNYHHSFYDTTHTYTRKIIEPLISKIPFSKL